MQIKIIGAQSYCVVVLNYELEKDLLGFGEGVKVLAPRQLVHNMSKRLRQTDEKFLLIVHIDVILKESLVHLLQEGWRKILPICISKN